MLHTSTRIPRSSTCLSNSRLEIFSKQVSKYATLNWSLISIEEPSVPRLNYKDDYVVGDVFKTANYPQDFLIFEYFFFLSNFTGAMDL